MWSLPTNDEAANYFLWRERDAVKNSVSMAERSLFSHRQLFGKSRTDALQMLLHEGVDWTEIS